MAPPLLLLQALLWIACASAVDGRAPPLLLAVGDVTHATARVLVDAPGSTSAALQLQVFRSTVDSTGPEEEHESKVLDRHVAMDMTAEGRDRPRVVVLDDLLPSTRYIVEFRWGQEPLGDAHADRVRFRTAPDAGGAEAEAARVLAVSCDRFVDDRDDDLWLELARDVEREPTHFGVAHLGDQVYVDAGDARVPVDPLPLATTGDARAVGERFQRLVRAFRAIYRSTWGRPALQRVLRVGAHWMLPDDHEIANNLNRERAARAFERWTDEALPGSERARLFELSLHYRAGLQVLYEFQYQLQCDVPWSSVDFLSQPLGDIVRALPLHFSVRISALRLLFLDARYDRAFLRERASDAELIGPEQRAALVSELQTWQRDRDGGRDVVPVVLSNVPLFFHSQLSAAIVYAVEQETYPGLAAQRAGLEDLFELLVGRTDASAASQAPVVRLLVGGDVHMMAHSRVCDAAQSRCVDQLITSGMTNGSTAIEDVKLIPFYALITRLTPVVDLVASCLASFVPQSVVDQIDGVFNRAPWRVSFGWVYLGRNYGVLEVARDGAFQWRQTVVAPHSGARRQLLQALFDATATPWLLALTLLAATLLSVAVAAACATRWVLGRKQHKRKHD